MRDFQIPGRSTVFAANGMIATSHPLASKIGVQILEAGGNAMDAAIAAAVAQGICEPQMTGIGGDCFVLVKPAGRDDIVALNGSGRAPKAASAQALRDAGHTTVPLTKPDAVTVPGAVDAFCRLSADWGKIGLAATLAPAIHYAEAGIPVAPRTAFDWAEAEDRPHGAGAKFFLQNGKALKAGQTFRAPGQAEVLRRISADGRDAFYEGEVAHDMVDALSAQGGVHTLDDFAATACDYTDPISGTYQGIEMVEHPPNGQGATAILINNILSQFDIASMDPLGAQRAHIEAEATKLGYDTRNRFLSDPDYMERLDYMVSMDTATALAKLIDPARAMESATTLSEQVHKETICLTVVDKDQMAVSLIYSIFNSFGSGIASDKFGILFQNRGAGFTLEAGHPNELGPGKRPMHTIIPGMLRKSGKVIMPFCVMGGAYQANGHARFVTNLVDFGMDVQSAIDAPRCFAYQGELSVERGYSDQVRQELSDLGHNVVIPEGPIGGAQAILIDHENGILHGASDPRKDGCALGY